MPKQQKILALRKCGAFLGGHTSFCRWLEPGEATVVSADPSGVLDDSEVKPPFFPPSDPKSRAPAGAGRGGGGGVPWTLRVHLTQ